MQSAVIPPTIHGFGAANLAMSLITQISILGSIRDREIPDQLNKDQLLKDLVGRLVGWTVSILEG
jgi:hypothetical protein